MNVRVGCGYDVHRLVEGRPLILGGVAIAHDRGLEGHSDADVLCHVVIDALLGALALGDIGSWFPPTEARWRDANSLELLRKVIAAVFERGWEVGNVDATIVAQAPQLSPYREVMAANIAQACQVLASEVSVKATTTEGLGSMGRGEGISVFATVLLRQQGTR